MILRLSDSFEHTDGCLECEVTMLNINYGHNQELMEKCRRLEEYSIFVDRVRSLSSDIKDFPTAINQAIDECISEGVLKDLLITQRAEVHKVVLETYDKELYETELKEDAYKDGFNDGQSAGSRNKLMELIQKKFAKGKSIETIAYELEESQETIHALIEQMNL